MGNATVPLRKYADNRHRVTTSTALGREMNRRALSSTLWTAIYLAEQAGLDDYVDAIGRLHHQIVSTEREGA